MKDRIKELEKQSVFYNEEEGIWELDHIKFAELIVREICDIVEEDGSAVLPLVIKRHFGVEE